MRARVTLFDSQPSRSLAAAPVGDITGPPRGEAGADGDSWYGQILGGGPDVNSELTGSAKFDIYDEMAKTDAAVKALQLFWTLPVRSAVWGLNPRAADAVSEPDAEAQTIRDAVNWQFGIEQQDDSPLDLSWKELLAQGLKELLTHGPCIEELVWDDARQWYDADGDPHLVRPLARLALRPARTISKVVFDKGRVKRVEQELSNARAMPGDKVSYMVYEREGNRWDGVSPLRAAWGPWTIKRALMVATGIGWDRFASGIPVLYHPDDPDSESRAAEIGRNVRQHERGYVHFPAEPSTGGGRPDSAWFMEILNGASSLMDPTPILHFLTDEIYGLGMLQFARQGMGQTGARASAETQIDPYFLAVQELADYVRRERARQAIRRFVEVNFGMEAAERRAPILTVSKVRVRNVTVLADAMSQLHEVGLTFTDADTVNDVRELLGFGQLADAAEAMSIDPAQLDAALRAAGLDAEALAAVVNALPPEFGIARNTVPQEGAGLTA